MSPLPDPDPFAAAEALRRAFAADAWREVDDARLAPALAVPSMLSEDEARAYCWLGLRARGLGAAVDLGAFAGGSAARLLVGLAADGRPFDLHAYDRFTARELTRRNHLYPAGVAETECDDILPLATAFLAPWARGVTLHRGDIARAAWAGGPVEILAVDAGKTPELADHIAATFFPALIPGVSVVIQQDFLHASLPWLAVQMARLRSCLAPVGRVARDCVVFASIAPATPAALATARTAGLDDAALIAGLRQAMETFAGDLPRPRLRAMIDKVKANPGIRIGWQMRK